MTILISAVLFALVFEAYNFHKESLVKEEKFLKVEAEANTLEAENERLKGEINYFSNKDNLEKELRSRFNYRKPDEKLIIVVPPTQ